MKTTLDDEGLDYRALVEGLPGLFMILDAALRIVEVSNAYAQSTLIRREDVLGKNVFEVFPDNPDDPTAEGEHNLYASLQRVIKSAAPDTMAVQRYDVRRPAHDGGGFDERYWTVINSPILGADGGVRYIIHKAEDVTEFIRLKQQGLEQSRCNESLNERAAQMEAEIFERSHEVAAASALLKTTNQALEQARISADAANRAKSAFLATMSHEIRTPMNGVLGMVHLLQRTPLNPKQLHYLDSIRSSGEHLLAIINDILDFSKIEAGKIQLASEHFFLADLLRETWNLIGERVGAKGLEQKTLCHCADLILCGDKTRLEQALVNYLGNAVKFTERGSITLACRVEETTEAGYLLRFEVTDTGIGLTEEQQERVFQAFEQADSSTGRKYQGTGLGLAITQRIAQLMGGETGVSSKVGVGSIFWLTCRLGKGVAPAPAGARETVAESPEKILARMSPRRKILVVDDEPFNREVLVDMLEHIGLTVEVASNGKEAVEKVRSTNYDVVLMDMQMPEMDGLRATKAIRALPGMDRLVIIAVTANAFDDDRAKCLEAGMDDFVAKPFCPDKLFEKLARGAGHSAPPKPDRLA